MSICFVPKDFVLSIGGCMFGLQTDVECHDLKTNSWRSISSLNEGRSNASSCLLAKNVYVFCGQNKCSPMSSIESISVEAL